MRVRSEILAFATLGSILVAAPPGHAQPVESGKSTTAPAAFDIVRTEVRSKGEEAVFRIDVEGKAGELKPKATGRFAGSAVYSYVWPTSLDSASVGFEPKQGILALAVTFHPDFDDGAGGAVNRHVWHPHWVALVPDDACGAGSLKVRDIPEGAKPRLPATWPGVPLLIDSPAYRTRIAGATVEVRVPLAAIGAVEGLRFDGVTSALKVNANLHAPLLCIANVFDVASGDLSLPGRASR